MPNKIPNRTLTPAPAPTLTQILESSDHFRELTATVPVSYPDHSHAHPHTHSPASSADCDDCADYSYFESLFREPESQSLDIANLILRLKLTNTRLIEARQEIHDQRSLINHLYIIICMLGIMLVIVAVYTFQTTP